MLERTTLTVRDTENNNAPIPDTLVYVYDDTGVVFLTQGRTDSSGELPLLLNPDSYIVRTWKPGFSQSSTALEVADTDGVTPQSFTLDVAGVSVTAPSSPQLCRLYGDFVRFDGSALANARVSIRNLFDPSGGFRVLETAKDYTTDSTGHVEFDVVRGIRLRIAIPGTSMTRDITVPNAATAELTTLMSQGADNFTVVT